MDDLESRLHRVVSSGLRVRTAAWQAFHRRWLALRPGQAVVRKSETLDHLHHRLLSTMPATFQRARQRLDQAETRLRLLSPQGVLDRGFSLTFDAESGRLIREAGQLTSGQRIRTRLHRGEVHSRVEGSS
jgi:exodeoxyribonuclease VII large subunit